MLALSERALRTLRATRFNVKYGAGGLPDETLITKIELYGRQVITRVRELMTHHAPLVSE
ncbi:MAG TPA: hypothetical protein VHR39_07690 [Propionibacteriaceae bacterium]|nr:hypothetical protein [Propionibacteriaceae bacterium]